MPDLPPRLKASVEATKVEYRRLGQSGLRISVPIFGAMSIGDKRCQPWAIEEDEVSYPSTRTVAPRPFPFSAH